MQLLNLLGFAASWLAVANAAATSSCPVGKKFRLQNTKNKTYATFEKDSVISADTYYIDFATTTKSKGAIFTFIKSNGQCQLSSSAVPSKGTLRSVVIDDRKGEGSGGFLGEHFVFLEGHSRTNNAIVTETYCHPDATLTLHCVATGHDFDGSVITQAKLQLLGGSLAIGAKYYTSDGSFKLIPV